MKKLINTITMLMLLPIMAVAHDPDQISYRFSQKDGTGQLVIHFTPKGALDILTNLHKDMDMSQAIRLTDYHKDFTNYFEKTIELKINDKSIGLDYSNASFQGHDANITFNLTGFSGSFEEIDLGVSSFTEIYRRTANHIFLPGHEPIVLDRDIQHYSSLDRYEPESSSLEIDYLKVVMLLIILAALGLGIKSVYLNKKQVAQ